MRNAIAEENRRRAAEAGGPLQRNFRPVARAAEGDLQSAGISVVLDDELDRTLDAMGRGRCGGCARCAAPIEIALLEETPDAVLCAACAREVSPQGR